MKSGTWWRRVVEHRERVRKLLGGHSKYRKDVHDEHPVYNFLFNYYRFKRKTLNEFSPGIDGAVVNDLDLQENEEWFVDEEGKSLCTHGALSVHSNVARISKDWIEEDPRRRDRIQRILQMNRAIARRRPSFGCYNAHEWAMLYRPFRKRNVSKGPSYFQENIPLRVSQEVINATVEKRFKCTHFDAARHFASEAVRFNRNKNLQPQNRVDYEQGGCLHANLDMFKWALRLFPFVSSELLADSLELAIEARSIDMRASPYDCSAISEAARRLGHDANIRLDPICVERASGRQEYRDLTKALYLRSAPIRTRLIECAKRALCRDFDSTYCS